MYLYHKHLSIQNFFFNSESKLSCKDEITFQITHSICEKLDFYFFFIEYPEDGNLSQEEDTEDYTETEEDELKGTEEEDEVESPKKEAKSKKRKASAVKGKGKAKVRAKSSRVTQTQM